MLRKFVGAVFLAAVTGGVTAAEEFAASITKIRDGRVTFITVQSAKDAEKAGSRTYKEDTLPVAKDVKVVYAKRNKETKKLESGAAVPGGLSHEGLKDFDRTTFGVPGWLGIVAWVITDEGGKAIQELRVVQGFSPPQKK